MHCALLSWHHCVGSARYEPSGRCALELVLLLLLPLMRSWIFLEVTCVWRGPWACSGNSAAPAQGVGCPRILVCAELAPEASPGQRSLGFGGRCVPQPPPWWPAGGGTTQRPELGAGVAALLPACPVCFCSDPDHSPGPGVRVWVERGRASAVLFQLSCVQDLLWCGLSASSCHVTFSGTSGSPVLSVKVRLQLCC